MPFIKPCNTIHHPDLVETETKFCDVKAGTSCCLYCKLIKECLPKWEKYLHSQLPIDEANKLIYCSIKNRPSMCSAVKRFLKENPHFPRHEVKPEKVQFS